AARARPAPGNARHRPGRHLRTVAVATAAVAALATWLLVDAARILVVTDPLPARADAIVVLSGSTSDRVLEAARLWHAGAAPIAARSRERLPLGAAALRARGVHLPEGHEEALAALVGLGVPEGAVHVLQKRARSTRTEANVIARWACAHGVRQLVVVTSP